MPTNLFTVPVFGSNQNSFKAGVDMLFHATQVQVQPIPDTVYAGTTCRTALYLLPTGPSPIQQVFYSDRTIAEIKALANAV